MAKTYYDLAQTRTIVEDLQALGLSHPQSLNEASILELQKQFNGAGSDAMPTILRKALSKLLRLKCTVAIHDWRYYKSDDTKLGQVTADKEFFANGHIEIYARLSWWNPLRYWSLYKLSVAYRLLQKFGESAYKSAHEHYASVNSEQGTVNSEIIEKSTKGKSNEIYIISNINPWAKCLWHY